MKSITENIREEMVKNSREAVSIAKKEHRINLDFSEASIEELEAIIQIRIKELNKGLLSKIFGPSDVKIEYEAYVWGSYLGEVMRKTIGGQWTKETPLGEEFALVYSMEDGGQDFTFPINKVGKRITMGEADNLHFYFQTQKNEHQNIKK